MKHRTADKTRTTRETDIRVKLDLDGTGVSTIRTGMGFLNHMLELFARHALIDLTVIAKGDLEVDLHHTVEDIGLTLGSVFDEALGSRKGIVRYGWSYVPMDETLCRVAVDLGGRPFFVKQMVCRKRRLRDFELNLFDDFFQSFVVQGRLNLHVDQLRGEEAHHAYESVFKAFGRAVRMACAPDARETGIPSSKGSL